VVDIVLTRVIQEGKDVTEQIEEEADFSSFFYEEELKEYQDEEMRHFLHYMVLITGRGE